MKKASLVKAPGYKKSKKPDQAQKRTSTAKPAQSKPTALESLRTQSRATKRKLHKPLKDISAATPSKRTKLSKNKNKAKIKKVQATKVQATKLQATKVQATKVKATKAQATKAQTKKSPAKKTSSASKAKKASKSNQGRASAVCNGGEISHGAVPATAISKTAPVKVKKPPKFSYVVEGLLAGMGRPTQDGHIQYLCEAGFKYLVTLTLNKPRTIAEYPGEGLKWVHIPIQDETPPSLEQIKEFVALVDRAKSENTSVAVHCAWGRGRTGTMLACYLAKLVGLTSEGAVEEIRRLRPGSVDTEKQKGALAGFVEYLESVDRK